MCTIYKFVTKIDETTKDNAEDLNLVMPIYNLIKYSSHCSEMTGSLWFYSKDEEANFKGGIVNTDNFKSFKYEAKLLENTADRANVILRNASIAVPLKYVSSFWWSLEMLY